ncbi:MAG: TIGR04255 family protein [Verrucomicrobia bacterium]|nr:TIGR04255 family protein [Verrucomicrobiota bacterium]
MIEIRTEETFQHLSRAPIVEAAIDIRARATVELEEAPVREQLESQLAEYTFLDSQRELQLESTFTAGKPQGQTVKDLGWQAVRFQSRDAKHIVQVSKNGLVFSRLAPYTDWAHFLGEWLLMWNLFKTVGQPAAIHRIGLRFINRIQLTEGEVKIDDYLNPAPAAPCGFDLPFRGFFQHDVLGVPGHPYAMNVVRAIQPATPGTGPGIILDIDVFTVDDAQLEDRNLSTSLAEMRWLKNKVFFGSITEKTKSIYS